MYSILKSDQVKYVVVSGGVCSSLGKGVTASSIGAVLKTYGYRVTAIKIDPYVNTDAGLMSPFEHGEVFVLDDGGEVDLDLGNYERNMDLHLGRDNNITTGKIYASVIDKERRGEYLGRTVQMVPHVCDEVMNWIERVAMKCTDGTGQTPHICMIELGGTVGDIESMLFLEALRVLRYNVGHDNFCLVHCSLVPVMGGVQKTKPTQHTVKTLLSLGLTPDIIVCRCDDPIQESTRRKISHQCGVPSQAILSVHNVPNLYSVPVMLDQEGVVNLLTAVLRLDRISKPRSPYMPGTLMSSASGSGRRPVALTKMLSMGDWQNLAQTKSAVTEEIRIAIVAKYTEKDVDGKAYTGDTYLSVIKALDHASIFVNRKLVILWIDSEDLQSPGSEVCAKAMERLHAAHGILVPGGFGDRGAEGKIRACEYARTQKKPFLGVCLGMQMAAVEFARNMLNVENATSEEFDSEKTRPHVMRYMPEISKEYMGGTMVLGARRIVIRPNSMACKLYGGLTEICERQRHRYEVSEKYIADLEAAGMHFVGRDTTGQRMEIIELDEKFEHPFFLATQCHPEFKSRPGWPAPPFLGLLLAAKGPEALKEGLEQCVKRGPANHYLPSSSPSIDQCVKRA